MPKVLRMGSFLPSQEVVQIPDLPLPPAPQEDSLEEGQAEAGAAEMAAERGPSLEEQAQQAARRILQGATSERARILERAQADAVEIQEQARAQAYQDAIASKQEEIVTTLSHLEAVMKQLMQEQEDYFQQYRDALSSFALEIAEKILNTSIQMDPAVMASLVQKAVSAVKNADWLSVQVSASLPPLVDKLQKDLASWAGSSRVELQPGLLPLGSCVVHTPDGVVDASVSTQLANLRKLLQQPE